MINDVSGLADTELADACAERGAALVITHTRTAPKTKAFPEYDDVVEDVAAFLDERVELARAHGVDEDRIVLDPGIDLAKTPAESVALLRALPRFAERGLPAAARRLAQGLRRRPHRGDRRRHAIRARSPPSAPGCAAARAFSASTTWRARATT